MAKALSEDLRRRVIDAVAAGATCRAAAKRFGVSASSAVKWLQRWRERGDVAAKPMGGDRRSGAIEAHRQTILSALAAAPDMTLIEVQALLAERGLTVGIGTIWRFLDRHRMTFKKKPRTQPSKRARTCKGHARLGARDNRRSTPSA